jgi:acyl carrier protein
MDITRVVTLVEDATQSVAGSLGPTTLLDSEVWDSMSRVLFMSLVEDEAGVELTADDMEKCATPQDLQAAIVARSPR